MRKKIWLMMVSIVILTLMSASIAEAGMFDWITGNVIVRDTTVAQVANSPLGDADTDNTEPDVTAQVKGTSLLDGTDSGGIGSGVKEGVGVTEIEQCDCCLCFTSTVTGTKGEGFSTSYELRSIKQLNSGVYVEYCGGCRDDQLVYTDTASTCETQLIGKEETCVVDCCNCWSEETGFALDSCENPIETLECKTYLSESESYFNDMCGEPSEDKPEKEEFDCCECVGEDGILDLDNCPDFDGKQQEYCLQWGASHSNYFGKGVCYEEDDPTEEPPELSPWECENRKDDDGDGQIDFKGGCDIDGDKVIDLIAQECVDIGDYYFPDDCCESFKDDSEIGYYVTYGVECSDGLDNDGDGFIDFAGACRVEDVIYRCDNREKFPATSETDCYMPEMQKTCEEVSGRFINPDTNCKSPFFAEFISLTGPEDTNPNLQRAPSAEGFEEENEGFFARLGKLFKRD